jgi:hypothetical protein
MLRINRVSTMGERRERKEEEKKRPARGAINA